MEQRGGGGVRLIWRMLAVHEEEGGEGGVH
jgi:hypothetical protein